MTFQNATALVAGLATLAVCASQAFAADDLVTAKRIGRADAPKTLAFFNQEGGPWSNTPEIATAFTKVYADFIAKHPDWKIIPQIQPSNIAQVHTRMLEQGRLGKGPDCASVDSFMLPLFLNAGVLADLTPYFTKEEQDDLFSFARDGVIDKEGKIRAWWWNTDLRVLYRNTEIIPEAPKTWDEMKAAALAAREKGFEGILFNGGRYEGTAFDWLANFWVQGGELVDQEGAPIFAQGENREKMLKALTYYKDLVDSGAAPKRVSNIVTYGDLNAAAAANIAASFIGGNWQWKQLSWTLPPEQFAKWAMSELPAPTADKHMTGVGGWTLASFSKDPEKVKMCVDLIKEVYVGAGNVITDALPTAKSLYEKLPEFSTPSNQIFAASLADGHARPGVPIYAELSNQLQIMISAVLAGKSTPEAALDVADKAVQGAYARMKRN